MTFTGRSPNAQRQPSFYGDAVAQPAALHKENTQIKTDDTSEGGNNLNSLIVSPSCLCFPFVNERLNRIKCSANVHLAPTNERSTLFSERSSK